MKIARKAIGSLLLPLPAPRGEVAAQQTEGCLLFILHKSSREEVRRHPSVSLRSTPPRGAQGGAKEEEEPPSVREDTDTSPVGTGEGQRQLLNMRWRSPYTAH